VSELKTGHGQYQKKLYVKGSELPKSILLTYNKTWLHHKQGTPDVPQAQKYSWNQTSASLNIPLNKSIVSFYNTGAVPAYVPPVYVPQAIIIKVLSLMNAPVIVMLYATRLVGLLIWIIIGGACSAGNAPYETKASVSERTSTADVHSSSVGEYRPASYGYDRVISGIHNKHAHQ